MHGRAAVEQMLALRRESGREVASGLTEFSEAAKRLSSDQPRLIDQYPDKWIAVAKEGVRASAETLDDLLSKVDRLGIPRFKLIIRLIERKPRTLIL